MKLASSHIKVLIPEFIVVPGDPMANARRIADLCAGPNSWDLIVFPAGSLTGFGTGTLADRSELKEETERAIEYLESWSSREKSASTIVLGTTPDQVYLISSVGTDDSKVDSRFWLDDGTGRVSVGIGWSLSEVDPGVDLNLVFGATEVVNIERDMAEAKSRSIGTNVIYVSPGPGEPSAGPLWSGLSGVWLNGVHAKSEAFSARFGDGWWGVSVLIGAYRKAGDPGWPVVQVRTEPPLDPGSRSDGPGILSDPWRGLAGSRTILLGQTLGIRQRLKETGLKKLVLGISGGSDSAWAMFPALQALRELGRSTTDLIAVSMPGPGTTERTRANARTLSEALGADFRESPITEEVAIHLAGIGHDGTTPDLAFENAQARIRTTRLFDIANREGALVIGTGDLSEIALGWCTYGGDHLSSYNPNGCIPKTVIRRMLDWKSSESGTPVREVLKDILGTPVSPELVPGGTQETEKILGPYNLTDYFLYYLLEGILSPDRIVAEAVWWTRILRPGTTVAEVVDQWERLIDRLSGSQFKRSCSPDAPAVFGEAWNMKRLWDVPGGVSLGSLRVRRPDRIVVSDPKLYEELRLPPGSAVCPGVHDYLPEYVDEVAGIYVEWVGSDRKIKDGAKVVFASRTDARSADLVVDDGPVDPRTRLDYIRSIARKEVGE